MKALRKDGGIWLSSRDAYVVAGECAIRTAELREAKAFGWKVVRACAHPGYTVVSRDRPQ